MTRYRPACAPEFRRRMVDLVRSGRSPEELSREFEPSAASIAGWVRRADAEDGTRPDVMPAAEREELARLRRENRQLRQERGILAKGALPHLNCYRTLVRIASTRSDPDGWSGHGSED